MPAASDVVDLTMHCRALLAPLMLWLGLTLATWPRWSRGTVPGFLRGKNDVRDQHWRG